MKRILSFVISVILTLGILPTSVSAQNYFSAAVYEPDEIFEANADFTADVNTNALTEYLFNKFYNCEETIDLTQFNIGFNEQNCEALKNIIYYELPICFHVSGYSRYQDITNNIISKIDVTYTTNAANYHKMYEEIQKVRDDVLAGIENNSNLSDVQKALLIHDRLALICEYDYIHDGNYGNMYGSMVEGNSVCQGYAEAYDYLLEEVGISSYLCSSDKLNHVWNIVKIDNKLYHVDVTWDDYPWQTGQRGTVGRVEHHNFLRSSEGIYSNGHDKDDYDMSPTDKTYDNYFWQSSNAAFQLVNNKIYYIDSNNQQIKEYNKDAVICDVSDDWISSHGIWGNYACLSTDGNDLLYSLSDAIYKYDFITNNSQRIYSPVLKQYDSIYSFNYKDGYLYCDINETPPCSNYGISGLYQTKTLYDPIKPTVSLTISNRLSSSQTIDIEFEDNRGIAGYYWGTDSNYENNDFYETNDEIAQITVNTSGTYYLVALDISGNVSDVKSATFYRTDLDANGLTVNPSFILTCKGKSFYFPSLTKDGYEFKGWATSNDSAIGVNYLTPTQNSTYYAIFNKNDVNITSIEIIKQPDKINYYIGDTLSIDGIKIKINYDDETHGYITSGFSISGFSSQSSGTKTVGVSYMGFSDTFEVTVSLPFIKLNTKNKTIDLNSKFELNANVKPDNASVTWTSSDAKIADVKNGVITAKAVGNSTITAKMTYNGREYFDTCEVTVFCSHKFGDYKYNNDATEYKDGTKTRSCNKCNTTETVTAIGTKLEKKLIDSSKQFKDISSSSWYKASVDYAVTYNIFKGTSEDVFSPSTNMTRAQFVQVFANLAGIDTTNTNVESGFSDVPRGKWFTGAVAWASSNGVVNGMGDGTFAPNANVTREQMCLMLVNYIEKYKSSMLKKIEKAKQFADDKNIASWSKEAVYKCADAKLVNGVGDNKFDPKSSATRAQGATIFSNFHKNYMK